MRASDPRQVCPLVARLIRLRKARHLSQKEAAELSGIGEKSISSFESGARIESMKVSHLVRLLDVYGETPAAFFAALEAEAARAAEAAERRRSAVPSPTSSLSWNA